MTVTRLAACKWPSRCAGEYTVHGGSSSSSGAGCSMLAAAVASGLREGARALKMIRGDASLEVRLGARNHVRGHTHVQGPGDSHAPQRKQQQPCMHILSTMEQVPPRHAPVTDVH